ncbi:MAG TPA: hypothetical protein PKD45_04805 [Flavobacteriales bacterium]|nr:hypothetical protein [Flavobacteriales bacterium]
MKTDLSREGGRPWPAKGKILLGLRAAVVACVLLGLAGCGILGRQAPQWESGTFTPDGKYYVYTYSAITITRFSKQGAVTRQQGIIRYYLQAIDCATGKDLYEKPRRIEEGSPCIMAAAGDDVWLFVQSLGGGASGPALFSLGEGRLKLGPADLGKANPGMPIDQAHSFYRLPGGQRGVAIDAGDGRRYAIDPRSGKFTLAPEAKERIERKDMDRRLVQCRSVTFMDGFSTTPGTREHITRRAVGITSVDDFIEPEFVTLSGGGSPVDEAPLMIYKGGIVMVSQMTTGHSSREAQVALLDGTDLHTHWAVVPPQGEYWMGVYDMERFSLQGNRLYVANRTHLVTIDADNGAVLQSRPFGEEE